MRTLAVMRIVIRLVITGTVPIDSSLNGFVNLNLRRPGRSRLSARLGSQAEAGNLVDREITLTQENIAIVYAALMQLDFNDAGVYKESGHNLVISHFSCKLACKLQLLLKNMTRRSEVQNKTFSNKDPINYPQNIYNMQLSVRDDVARTVSVLNV